MSMLSHKEELELRWNDFKRRYGHYPDERQCTWCGLYFKTSKLIQFKIVLGPKSLHQKFYPPQAENWLICETCLEIPASEVRKGLNESGRSDGIPVQLPLEFPDVNSPCICKSRT